MAQEQKLQTRIREYLEADGWEVIKTIVLSKSGYEDLFCFRDGKTMFIECKAEKKTPGPLQAFRIEQHRKNGFVSFFANTFESFLTQYNP